EPAQHQVTDEANVSALARRDRLREQRELRATWPTLAGQPALNSIGRQPLLLDDREDDAEHGVRQLLDEDAQRQRESVLGARGQRMLEQGGSELVDQEQRGDDDGTDADTDPR